ncbi:MAG: flagellar protein FlaG [Gammaproteobacteria bacterium]
MVTHVGYTKYQPVNGETRALRDPPAAPAADAARVSPQAVDGSTVTAGDAIPAFDARALDAVVEDVSRNVQTRQRSLQFSVDERSGRTIITVIDKETDEIIRQIPPEEVVALAEHLDGGGGFLIRAEA